MYELIKKSNVIITELLGNGQLLWVWVNLDVLKK